MVKNKQTGGCWERRTLNVPRQMLLSWIIYSPQVPESWAFWQGACLWSVCTSLTCVCARTAERSCALMRPFSDIDHFSPILDAVPFRNQPSGIAVSLISFFSCVACVSWSVDIKMFNSCRQSLLPPNLLARRYCSLISASVLDGSSIIFLPVASEWWLYLWFYISALKLTLWGRL